MSSANEPRNVPDTVSRACTEGAGTVQALAQEVGVSYAALCSWSRGRRQPPPHRLMRLAEVLDERAERLREIAVELRASAAAAGGNVAPATVAATADARTAREHHAHDSASQRSRYGLRIERGGAAPQQRPDEAPLPRAAASAPPTPAAVELPSQQR